MTKLLSLAVLVLACLFLASCKKETCAKCKLREYCAACDFGFGDTDFCGPKEDFDSFESACVLSGGDIINRSNSLQSTVEYCNEESSVVNDYIDDKEADGYECEFED